MPKRLVDKCVDCGGGWSRSCCMLRWGGYWNKGGLLCDVCFKKGLNRLPLVAVLPNWSWASV